MSSTTPSLALARPLLVLLSCAWAWAAANPAVTSLSALPEEAWTAGRLIEATHLQRWTAQQVHAQSVLAFGSHGQPPVENGVDLWQLRVATTGLDGDVVAVTAQFFHPVEPLAGSSPLFVYGSGTTGVGPACAPSRETLLPQPLGYYRELLAPYAARGFATVFPDYLGFDDPTRPQAYFHALSEAHVLLDAARAVREFYDRLAIADELQEAVFFGGYSQGGHAAFAVADHHRSYAPDVDVRGVIGFAATTDVAALLGEAAYYAPYVVLSYRSVYGADKVDPAQVLGERWLRDLDATAGTICVDRAQQVYPFAGAPMYTAAFERGLRQGDLSAAAPGFADALKANHTGLSGHGVPALVIQGGRDVIVSDRVQERFVAALCQAGSDVQYVNYPTARHRDTRPAGFEASIAWMHHMLVPDLPAPNNCPE